MRSRDTSEFLGEIGVDPEFAATGAVGHVVLWDHLKLLVFLDCGHSSGVIC